MTTYVAISPTTPLNTNDALFRAWTSAFNDALVGAGLIQTADTGQANFATILAPTGANMYTGYVIYRFNDTLSASSPLFMKFEFGTSGTSPQVQVRVTFGTGSDGIGGIVNQIVQMTLAYTSSANTVQTNRPIYATHSQGFFGIIFHGGAYTGASTVGTPTSFALLVSRTASVSGDYIPGSFHIIQPLTAAANSTGSATLYNVIGNLLQEPVSTTSAALPGANRSITGIPLSGGLPSVYPIFHLSQNGNSISSNICGLFSNEIPAGTIFKARMSGRHYKTFISLAHMTNRIADAHLFSFTTSTGFGMLWE